MPIFTLFLLLLDPNGASFDGSPLYLGMGANGPLAFKSFAACESVKVEVAKRAYPNASCVAIETTKGNP